MSEEMKAVGEWILVKVPEESVTKGGIIVPKGSSTQHSATDAVVLSIGPDAFDKEGPVKSEQFKVGDSVKVHRQLLLKVADNVFFIKPNGILSVG